MSQNETVEDLDTTVTEEEVATSTDDNEEENTTSDDEITWEEIARLRKSEESLKKANKKIAMLEKGQKKSPETISPDLSEDALDALLEKRDFYKSNATAKDLKEEIEAMVSASKGRLDRQKAFEVLSGDAEVEENRKAYANPIIAGNKSNTVGFTPISIDKYDKLSAKDQSEYNAKSTASKGGVVFK